MADEKHNDLGEFLRARRSLISPTDSGLPEDGQRRVEGLRREEVALLAGVSTDYYTRLEQGRERHPSRQVLEAVARVLRLDGVAAEHMFHLAQPGPRSSITVASTTVDEDLLNLIDNVLAAPACVVGPALNVLAANRMATELYSGFTRFDSLLRMVFLDPFATRFYDNWDEAAAGAVRTLRAQSAPFPDDPEVTAVIADLTVHSPAFVTLWSRHEVLPRTKERKRLHHPTVGSLDLHYRSMAVTGTPGQYLFTYLAEPGSASQDALALLARAPEHAPPMDSTPRSRGLIRNSDQEVFP